MTVNLLRTVIARAWSELDYLRLAVGSGVVGIDSPLTLLSAGDALLRHGALPALLRLAAGRYGDRAAVIDDLGTLSYRELDDRSNRLANEWRKRGLRTGEGVAILARNHRGLLDAVFAAAKCGARIILLNTDFAGPQLRDVTAREGADLLVYDEEYESILGDLSPERGAYRAWSQTGHTSSLESLITAGSPATPPFSRSGAKIILLTSGTTGTPKGAPRSEPRSLEPLGAILSKVPFRTREVTECPAPLFHTLGFAMSLLAIGFGSTLVIRRRFDPQRVIDSMAEHHATALIVVPVMLARMVELGPEAVSERDLSALRIVFVAGSQLGAELCRRVTAIFGPVVYNLYGSTEVAYATVATPEDLAEEPGCVGSPVAGAVVEILDGQGEPVPPGTSGRIFVRNAIPFDGYTGGGGKEQIRGLMATGDVGHFDFAGRLFIDGRDDDMIVSGGENVFPAEVEELLDAHPDVREAAVIGVPDDEYGARLVAFVVRTTETLGAEEIKAHVKSNLARYKVPREVVFIDELPRNPTGKVLKRRLREWGAGGEA
ncbi:acyl-CoA synthetase [Nocardia nova]|jgi:fatty-acyl-CoA synthase|uniref:acyl-CoA synthetase n=1 Tax=Nocardia nova TaxID=37330 RepID=UPI001893FE5F|nr:acyl-CoA synthetase [Nocardia nova]MBF6144767.1 acyl-CoA synthetase [Nocardia nova]MDN2498400.1 AMP-binding protein [Nocardia nova]